MLAIFYRWRHLEGEQLKSPRLLFIKAPTKNKNAIVRLIIAEL